MMQQAGMAMAMQQPMGMGMGMPMGTGTGMPMGPGMPAGAQQEAPSGKWKMDGYNRTWKKSFKANLYVTIQRDGDISVRMCPVDIFQGFTEFKMTGTYDFDDNTAVVKGKGATYDLTFDLAYSNRDQEWTWTLHAEFSAPFYGKGELDGYYTGDPRTHWI